MAKSTGQVFVATQSGSAYVEGLGDVPFIRGVTRVRAGHPLLKGREYLFEPVDLTVHYDIEEATAAPGEKRGERDHPEKHEPEKSTPQKSAATPQKKS